MELEGRDIPILACLFMRRLATHSTRVAPELSTQLRIVFSLISVRILLKAAGIEGQHLELYHRGSIDYLDKQTGTMYGYKHCGYDEFSLKLPDSTFQPGLFLKLRYGFTKF